MLEEHGKVGAKEGLSNVQEFLLPLSIFIIARNSSITSHVDDDYVVQAIKPQDVSHVPIMTPYHHRMSHWHCNRVV